jgi:TetR/AcrR family transcriptional regulator, regulator of biofilm formation and stress response
MTSVAEPRMRRSDPDRRGRIVAACLQVVAESGVAGASARRIAAKADVPLGSVTYHFATMDALLREAFTSFSEVVSDRFVARMAEAGDRAAAIESIVELIEFDVLVDPGELVLTHELYTLAAHDPGYRSLTNAWMARSRSALEAHFDPATARILDALIEGLTIHRALDVEAPPAGTAADAVRRIVG